jgi:hypothetical protein
MSEYESFSLRVVIVETPSCEHSWTGLTASSSRKRGEGAPMRDHSVRASDPLKAKLCIFRERNVEWRVKGGLEDGRAEIEQQHVVSLVGTKPRETGHGEICSLGIALEV